MSHNTRVLHVAREMDYICREIRDGRSAWLAHSPRQPTANHLVQKHVDFERRFRRAGQRVLGGGVATSARHDVARVVVTRPAKRKWPVCQKVADKLNSGRGTEAS